MYAVVEIGAAQFKVSEGDFIKADRMDEKEGKSIKFDKVLLFSKGNDIRIGQPYLKDVKVEATVVDHISDVKKVGVKYKARKGSKVLRASRHKLTTLNITKIEA
jgi:large subunit ribosomal protein L21